MNILNQFKLFFLAEDLRYPLIAPLKNYHKKSQ